MHILRTSKWDMFVQINEPSFRDLLLEFLATFSFEKHSVTFDKPNTIQFWLWGHCFHISLMAFSVHCGFYTPDFILALSTSNASMTWAMPFQELFGMTSMPPMP